MKVKTIGKFVEFVGNDLPSFSVLESLRAELGPRGVLLSPRIIESPLRILLWFKWEYHTHITIIKLFFSYIVLYLHLQNVKQTSKKCASLLQLAIL